MTWQVYEGECRARLREMPDESCQSCITSPPYFGLRDYGHAGQIGLESAPDKFVAALVAVFAEVRRVLRSDGTLWLNIGDSYAGSSGGEQGQNGARASRTFTGSMSIPPRRGAKTKDLLMIPAQVALALRSDGWYLRSEIVWAKPNPMPESVTDRPTSCFCCRSRHSIFTTRLRSEKRQTSALWWLRMRREQRMVRG